MNKIFPNDKKNISDGCDVTNIEEFHRVKWFRRFANSFYVAKAKNLLPSLLKTVKTCKDLRLLIQKDAESALKAMLSLPNVGEKTAWLMHNFVNQEIEVATIENIVIP